MAGPWEDYAPISDANEGVAPPWQDYATQQPTVKPGDVAARKAQMAAQAAAEGTNQVRPDLTITGELGAGLSNALGGAVDVLKAITPGSGTPLSSLLPDVGLDKTLRENIGGVLSSPLPRAALGAVQTVASPLAPLSNLASRAGEKVADVTGSEGLGALTQSATDVLTPGALLKAAKAVKPVVKGANALQLNKEKALRAAKEGEAVIAQAEDRAAQAVTASQKQAETARAAARAKAAQQTDELTAARAEAQAATDDIEQAVRKAKEKIPGKDELKAIAGDELGEATGLKFKESYQTTRTARKEQFNELYEEVLKPAESVVTPAEGYKTAINKVLGEGGASRPLATPAERAAQGAKKALDVEDIAADQLDDLSKYGPAAREQIESELKSFIQRGAVAENPTVRELILEQKRLRAGERAAYAVKNDNLGRQFKELQQSISDDIEKAMPGATKQLAAVDAKYASEYAPYFSKQSTTRAIADQDPSRIAQAVIRPRSDPKAVEKLTRAYELIEDPALQKQVAGAHLNGLIDEASRAKDFRDSFVKSWERYTNPSGNNNKVLRAAYGRDYDRVNSFVNQMKNATPRSFDEVAEAAIKATNKTVKELPQEDAISGLLKSTVREATRAEREGVRTANKIRELDIKATRKKIQDDVRKFVGKGAEYQDGKIVGTRSFEGGKFIGQLYLIEAIFDAMSKGAGAGMYKATAGAGLLLSRAAINKLVASEKGIGMLKQALRNAPGTTQAFATARIIQNFLDKETDE